MFSPGQAQKFKQSFSRRKIRYNLLSLPPTLVTLYMHRLLTLAFVTSTG